MPQRSLDAVFFVEDGPDMCIRDGLFHISYEIGANARFEIVLPPRIFLAAMVRANEIARDFGKSADIIPVDFDSKFERVYPKDKSA